MGRGVSGPRDIYRDTKAEGLVLRVGRTGTRTFAPMMRDGAGQPQTYTIGHHPDVLPKDARRRAEETRHDVRHEGAIPTAAAKPASKGGLTPAAPIAEAQPVLAARREGWRPRGERSPGNGQRVVESVFRLLPERDVEALGAPDLSVAVKARRRDGDATRTANGQASRAMS